VCPGVATREASYDPRALPLAISYETRKKGPIRSQGISVKSERGRSHFHYQKDQIVYTQGESADSVFYIQSGKVKKIVVSEQGKEAVVALLGAGDFVGEGCSTGEPVRLATVSAMTDCVIVRIAKADITRVIHEEPAYAELFIAHLLARNLRGKRIWSINCSIRARNGWHGSFCSWRILARKVGRNQS
jgi:Cyclic nucleotide-binding domain